MYTRKAHETREAQGVVSDDWKVRDTLGALEWRRGSQYRGSRVTPVEGLAHSKGASRKRNVL